MSLVSWSNIGSRYLALISILSIIDQHCNLLWTNFDKISRLAHFYANRIYSTGAVILFLFYFLINFKIFQNILETASFTQFETSFFFNFASFSFQEVEKKIDWNYSFNRVCLTNIKLIFGESLEILSKGETI